MARPLNRSTPRELAVSLPADVHDYLVYLASIGKIAVTENQVAAQLIIRAVDDLQRERYHEHIA